MPTLSPLIPLPIMLIIFVAYLWSVWKLWKIDADKKPVYLIFRFLATLLIFFCALRPSWKTSKKITSKESLYILIDSSLSMSIKDEQPSRFHKKIELLAQNSQLIDKLEKLKIETRFFDSKVHFKEPTELGETTSISKAIQQCLQEDIKIRNFLLLSDGLHNEGPGLEKIIYNLKQKGISVYFISAGKEELKGVYSDASVEKINSTEFIQIDQKLKVSARVRLRGLKDKKQKIELVHKDKVLISKTYQIKNNDQVLEAEFTLPEKTFEEGYKLFKIQLPARKSEITPMDNSSERLIYVRKEGLKVLLLTGSPSPDYKFIRRTIEANPFFNLIAPNPFLLSSEDKSEFWNDTNLNEFDLIILCRPNNQNLNKDFYNNLYDYYTLNKKGVVFISGEDFTNFSKQNLRFSDSLPLKIFTDRIETKIKLVSKSKEHFILNGFDLPEDIQTQGLLWDSEANPGTSIILENNNKPVIACRDWGKSRLAMIQTNSLWQLKLNGNGNFYEELFNRLFYFVCSREEDLKDKLTIRSDRLNYINDERQFFTASLKNEKGLNILGAQVNLNLSESSKIMSPLKQFYTYTNEPGANGILEFSANAKIKDQIIESNKAKILIKSQRSEFKDISTNTRLLNNISENTDGEKVLESEFPEWLKNLNKNAKIYSASTQIKKTPLWDNSFILVLIVCFFSLEWYWRKFQ